MSDYFQGLLWTVGIYATIVTFVATAWLQPIERVATDRLRKQLVDLLTSRETKKVSDYFEFCTGIFDRFFGKRHLSFRCFFRSLLISLSGFVISLLLVAATSPPFVTHQIMVGMVPPLVALPTVIFMFFWACVTDYLSLWQTRWILKFAARRTAFSALVMIIADVVLSFFIFVFVFPLWIGLIFFALGLILLPVSGAGFSQYQSFVDLPNMQHVYNTTFDGVIGLFADSVVGYLKELRVVAHSCFSVLLENFNPYPSYYQTMPTLIYSRVAKAPNGLNLFAPSVLVPLGTFYFMTYLTNAWTYFVAVSVLVYRLDSAHHSLKRLFKLIGFDFSKDPIQGAFLFSTLVILLFLLFIYTAYFLIASLL